MDQLVKFNKVSADHSVLGSSMALSLPNVIRLMMVVTMVGATISMTYITMGLWALARPMWPT